MVVEKNTGIMLKFLSFQEGLIQYSVTTEWIQIDKGLKESMFQKDSAKYEKMKTYWMNRNRRRVNGESFIFKRREK